MGSKERYKSTRKKARRAKERELMHNGTITHLSKVGKLLWRGGPIAWHGGPDAFLYAERGHRPYFATDERTTTKTKHDGRGDFPSQTDTVAAIHFRHQNTEPNDAGKSDMVAATETIEDEEPKNRKTRPKVGNGNSFMRCNQSNQEKGKGPLGANGGKFAGRLTCRTSDWHREEMEIKNIALDKYKD